jgi:hypothetical protein
MTQYDDDEVFENGVLRDGARHHVRMHMRDSLAPMITDGTRSAWLASAGLAHRSRRQRTRCALPR